MELKVSKICQPFIATKRPLSRDDADTSLQHSQGKCIEI